MTIRDGDDEWMENDSPRLDVFACPAVSLASRLSLDSVDDPDPCIHSCQQHAIRAVSSANAQGGSEYVEIVVDSGADESCLPSTMSTAGFSVGNEGPGFLDAQGNKLSIHDRRTLVLEIPNETCLISSVSSPLFAVGKLC